MDYSVLLDKLHIIESIQYHNTTSYAYILDLDSEQLDKTGIDLGATGRLALMAKLAQGTGMQLPQAANQALNSAVMQVWSVVRHLGYWGSNFACILSKELFKLLYFFVLGSGKSSFSA